MRIEYFPSTGVLDLAGAALALARCQCVIFSGVQPSSAGVVSLAPSEVAELDSLRSIYRGHVWLGLLLRGNTTNVSATSVREACMANRFAGCDVNWEGEGVLLADYDHAVRAIASRVQTSICIGTAAHYVAKAVQVHDAVSRIAAQVYHKELLSEPAARSVARLKRFTDSGIPAHKIFGGLGAFGSTIEAGTPLTLGWADLMRQGASPTATLWRSPAGRDFHYGGIWLTADKVRQFAAAGFGSFTWRFDMDVPYCLPESLIQSIDEAL